MLNLHLVPKHYEIPKNSGNALRVTHYTGEPDFLFHFHPEYELVLVLGGSGSRLVGRGGGGGGGGVDGGGGGGE
jgi:hypothetical protein